jgi:hypothetical protein
VGAIGVGTRGEADLLAGPVPHDDRLAPVGVREPGLHGVELQHLDLRAAHMVREDGP